jgi:hypothetical protein
MSDAETVWVPQARQGGGYRVYHTDRDCPRLEQADRVREKTTKTIPHRLRECKDCAGDVAEYDRGDSEGHLQSLEEAAKSGFEIRTDGGLEGHTDRQDDRPAFLPPDVEYVECYICGQHIEDLSRVEGLDVSGPEEFYPTMKPVCRTHDDSETERPHILTEDETPALDVYLNDERLNRSDGGPKHWLFETDIDGAGAFYEVTVGIQNGLGVGAERWQTFDRSDQDGRLVSFEEVPADDAGVKHRFEGVETDDVVELREVER